MAWTMSPKLCLTRDTVTSSSSQKLCLSSVAKRSAAATTVRAATNTRMEEALRRTAGDAGDPSKHSGPEALLQPFDTLFELRDVLLQAREIDLADRRALDGVARVFDDVRDPESERRLAVTNRAKRIVHPGVLDERAIFV